MYHRRPPKYRYICYSCVTGQAVWVYQGQSREGMRKAYQRARRHEVTLERRWSRLMERRRSSILFLLNECMAAIPILGTLTKAQREAIRTLQHMIDNPPEFSSPLLDHDRERRHQNYLEKRRRRYWKDEAFRLHERERRRKKPQTKKLQNMNYDK